MDKKKVLFLMHMPPPVHGAATVGGLVRDSVRVRERFECRYVNYSISRSVEEIDRFSWKKVPIVTGLLWKFFRETIRFRPDIVYVTPSFRPLGFRKDCLVVRFLKWRKCRVILHLHNKGVSTLAGRPGYDRKFRSFFSGAKVILLSEHLYPDISRYVGREAVRLCHNGVDPITKTDLEKESEGSPLLLFMSNVLGSKGAADILDACSILKGRGIPFRCRFVGNVSPGFSSDAFARMVKERDLEGIIGFDGPLYGKEKEDAFRAADVFVHPTYNDCFPLVILEAMSAGLPVVANEEGGIPDEVVDGVTGFLSGKGDVSHLARCLETLLTDPDARRRMGEAGRERYELLFTKKRFEDRLVQILEEFSL